MLSQKINYVTLVVDESGSMSFLQRKVCELMADTLQTLKDRSRAEGQTTYLAITKFADRVNKVKGFDPIVTASIPDYYPNGSTALIDAISDTVAEHNGVRTSLLDDVAHLIIVLTDGAENHSSARNRADFPDLMRRVNAAKNITLALNVPPGNTGECVRWGIPKENVREWAATEKGVQETQIATKQALNTYYTQRSFGATKSTNFYRTTTDLSQVTPTQLSECQDMTNRFRSTTVPAESRIDQFVQQVTGVPYVRGTAFYQLTKPEEIQANKDVLIRRKGERSLYGGYKAREIVGLQPYKTGKVTPGNHANYDIFVQSHSDNRKLVRGTTLMVAK